MAGGPGSAGSDGAAETGAGAAAAVMEGNDRTFVVTGGGGVIQL